MAKEALKISTASRRRLIEVDGKKYELLGEDELRLDAGVRLQLTAQAFVAKGMGTEQEARSLSEMLAKSVRDIVPGLPADVMDKVTDLQRMEILAAFLAATEKPAPRTAAASPASS